MWSLPDVSSLAFTRSFLQRPGSMRLGLLGGVSMSLPSDLWEVSKRRGRVGAYRYTLKLSPFLLMGMSCPWYKWRWKCVPRAHKEETSFLVWTSDGGHTWIPWHGCHLSEQLEEPSCQSSSVSDGAIAFVSFGNVSSVSQSISCLWLLRKGIFSGVFFCLFVCFCAEENKKK